MGVTINNSPGSIYPRYGVDSSRIGKARVSALFLDSVLRLGFLQPPRPRVSPANLPRKGRKERAHILVHTSTRLVGWYTTNRTFFHVFS
jgi:hypothetical protein